MLNPQSHGWRRLIPLYCALAACAASILLALPALAVWLGLPPEGDAMDYRVPVIRWMVAHRAFPNWPWTFVEDYPALGDLAMALLYAASPHLMRLVPIAGYIGCGYFAGRIYLFLSEKIQPPPRWPREAAFFTAAAWAFGLRPVALQANLLMVDTLGTGFTVGAVYFFLARRPAWSGVLAACALSTRYTTWVNVTVLGLLWIARALRDRRKNRAAPPAQLGRFFLIALLGALPWMIRNGLVNQNPFFPIATKFFNGFAMDVFDLYGRGKGPLALLLLPYDILYTNTFVRGFYDYTIGKFFYAQLAACALALAWKPGEFKKLATQALESPEARYLGLFVLLHTLSWFYSSQQLRFLAPGLLLVNLGMLYVCARLLPAPAVGLLTLLCCFSVLSIQKDSLMIAFGKKRSSAAEAAQVAAECFRRAGVKETDLVGHYSRDSVLGYFSHPFVYGGTNSYFLPMMPPPPVPDWVYDPFKLHQLAPDFTPWPEDAPCLWKRMRRRGN